MNTINEAMMNLKESRLDENNSMYIDEYYASKEEAEKVEKTFKEQGRKTKIEQIGNEYALWVSYGKKNENNSKINITTKLKEIKTLIYDHDLAQNIDKQLLSKLGILKDAIDDLYNEQTKLNDVDNYVIKNNEE